MSLKFEKKSKTPEPSLYTPSEISSHTLKAESRAQSQSALSLRDFGNPEFETLLDSLRGNPPGTGTVTEPRTPRGAARRVWRRTKAESMGSKVSSATSAEYLHIKMPTIDECHPFYNAHGGYPQEHISYVKQQQLAAKHARHQSRTKKQARKQQKENERSSSESNMKIRRSASAGVGPSPSHAYHKGPLGIVTVELNRHAGETLGVGIAGGADKPYPPIVSCIRAGSIAHRSDRILVGDRLIAVNRIRVDQLRHSDIYTLLRNAGDVVRLDFEYNLNDAYFERPLNAISKVTDICIEKESDSFGFTMRGGAYGPDTSKTRPITVTSIRPGGPADREGRIRVGDRVLSVDGVDVYSATLAAVQELMDRADRTVNLSIEYDVSVIDAVKNATGALLLEIDKPPGVDLGLELKMCHNPRKQRSIYVHNVIPASIGDRCGALNVGDELLAVEGISLEYTTLPECKQLLRGQPQSDKIKLEVVPVCAADQYHHSMQQQQILHQQQNGGIANGVNGKLPPRSSDTDQHTPTEQRKSSKSNVSFRKRKDSPGSRRKEHRSTPPTNQRTSYNTNSILKSRAQSQDRNVLAMSTSTYENMQPVDLQGPGPGLVPNQNGGSVPSLIHGQIADQLVARRRSGPTNRSSSHNVRETSGSSEITAPDGSVCASISGAPCGQVCHSEVMEVVLHSYARGGFGLVLHRQANNDGEPNVQPPLFISYIERGSPAEKCGVLQVGDRVLAINDWCTANGTVEDASHRIRKATSPLTLTLEFDVIETVLPSSGVFTVKLAKRAQNLGIVISANQQGHKGEPVIISEIRTGSVAHRCGTLAAGDRLLAIDNIPLDTCTVEESVRLLHRGSDIVKLRIRKAGVAEDSENESTVNNTVVYSVELSRRGGPLGITIASTDEPGDPILISQLAPGGLADRTGALHVGDRLLAINGHSIHGKRVTEAMQMLASCQDKVSLKIARQLAPMSSGPSSSSDANRSSGTGTSSSGRQSGSSQHHHHQYKRRSGGAQQYIEQGIEHDSQHWKLGTPVQSIDSAVESLEDSPVSDQQQAQQHDDQTKTRSAVYSEQLSVQVQRMVSGNNQRQQQQPTSPLSTARHHKDKSHHPHHQQQQQHNIEMASTSSASDPQSSCCDSGLGSSEPGGSGTGTNSADPFCHCPCQQSPSASQKEDWMRVLEALETVGESEMLRRLEESILGGQVPSCMHGPRCRPAGSTYETSTAVTPAIVSTNERSSLRTQGATESRSRLSAAEQLALKQQGSTSPNPSAPARESIPFPVTNTILRHPYSGTQHQTTAGGSGGSRDSSVSLTDSSEASGARRVQPAPVPPPKPPYPIPSQGAPSSGGATLHLKSYGEVLRSTKETSTSSSQGTGTVSSTQEGHFIAPTTTVAAGEQQQQPKCYQDFAVTLYKDADYNDFGFSVSDGVVDRGVFINKIRPGGPAAVNGKIRPFDQLVSINGTSVEMLDCILAVPLLLSATDQVELVCRRAQNNNASPNNSTTTTTATLHNTVVQQHQQQQHHTPHSILSKTTATIVEEEEIVSIDGDSISEASTQILMLKDSAV